MRDPAKRGGEGGGRENERSSQEGWRRGGGESMRGPAKRGGEGGGGREHERSSQEGWRRGGERA